MVFTCICSFPFPVVEALRKVLLADEDASYLIMSRVHVYDYTLAFAGSREACERAKRTMSRGKFRLAVTVVHPLEDDEDDEDDNVPNAEGMSPSGASVCQPFDSLIESTSSAVDNNMPMSSRARASLHAQLQRHSSSHLVSPDQYVSNRQRTMRRQERERRSTLARRSASSGATTAVPAGTSAASSSSGNSATSASATSEAPHDSAHKMETDEKSPPEGGSAGGAVAARPPPRTRFVRVARPLILPESLMVLLVEWLSSLCEVSEAFRDIIHELYKTPLRDDEELLVSPMNTAEVRQRHGFCIPICVCVLIDKICVCVHQRLP